MAEAEEPKVTLPCEVKAPTSPRIPFLFLTGSLQRPGNCRERVQVGPKAVKSTKTYGASLANTWSTVPTAIS
jgi:hypothetical protein